MKPNVLLFACALFFSFLAQFAPAQKIPALLPTHRDLVYGEAGGQKQAMDIYYPNMLKPDTALPVLLLVHGGAWRSGSKGDMALAAAIFTKENYVVVSVGYRLYDPKTGRQNVYPAQYDDVQRAVRFLRANADKYGIDSDRMGAMGFSAGGHLVSLLGTTDTRDNSDKALEKFSSRVNAVINVGGPSDLVADYSKYKIGNDSVQDLVDDFIGRDRNQAEITKFKRESSPLFRIDEKTVPHLLFHGDKDTVVPVDNSRKMAVALKAAKIPCELHEAPGEGHGLKIEAIQILVEKSLAFLKLHLPEKK